MKNLMIISFLLLGSCSVSIDKPEKISRYSFPTEWQGYYTKISNGIYLPEEFKVSDKYMSYKDTSRFAEYDDFYTYQIEKINEDNTTEFSFDPEDAYNNFEWDGVETWYIFKKLSDGNIEVKKYEIFLILPSVSTATYKKTPL